MNGCHFGDSRVRMLLLGGLALLLTAVTVGKLYYEQIDRGEAHRERISRQSIRRIRIPARRGKIFTSDMKVLGDNRGGCMIQLYPEEMRQPGRRSRTLTIDYIERAVNAIAGVLGRPAPYTRKEISRHLNVSPGLPLTLFRSLPVEDAAKVLELARYFNGIGIEEDASRVYPEGEKAAHILGYTGRADPRSASDRRNFFYYVPDLIGRAGLERQFDRIPGQQNAGNGLIGVPGYSLAQVDHLGFIRNRRLEFRPPEDGMHLVLTLDSRAQHLAETALAGRSGAFVVLDADTGAVLAMASSPAYDIGRFVPYVPADYYRELMKDPLRPMLNRALFGTYTPGSILKPLVAMALLENGLDPAARVVCDGFAKIGRGGIRCAARHGHGDLDLFEALERSCNEYFIVNGIQAGLDVIAPVLRSAGLGEATGFELGGVRGDFPSAELKKKRFGGSWNAFDTGQLSIGQGLITVTPLQVACYVAAIANGGRLMRPYVAERMIDSHGMTVWHNTPEQRGSLAVSPEHLELVRRGMHQVVHAPQGSGRRAKTPVIELWGKTGSAEVGSGANRRKNTWFTAFGSCRGRTYAAVLLIERGDSGGGTCAPRVREFFDSYLGTDDMLLPLVPETGVSADADLD